MARLDKQVVYMEERDVVALLDEIAAEFGLRGRGEIVRDCVKLALKGGDRAPIRRHYAGASLFKRPARGR